LSETRSPRAQRVTIDPSAGRYAQQHGPDDRKAAHLVAGDPLERALLEIDVAISPVLPGVAVTITPCCFEAAEGALFMGPARAQAAGCAFCLRREAPAPVSLAIGPMMRPPVIARSETES
jgi:hypothetical protein